MKERCTCTCTTYHKCRNIGDTYIKFGDLMIEHQIAKLKTANIDDARMNVWPSMPQMSNKNLPIPNFRWNHQIFCLPVFLRLL